jgi:MFS transporter, ACS family, tartrate transporter
VALEQDQLAKNTLRALNWRLIPFVFLLYIVAWLDRVNIGFAALQMNQRLGFGPEVYGLGAGIFFIGYALCEVPSNILLAKVGARRWIARIMITWGLLSMSMMWVHDAASFYLLRFMLGVAEAGFLPGIIYYLGEWYPRSEHAQAVGKFMAAIPFSTIVGGPLASAILALDSWHGLYGWQWLFLLEGMPAVALGFVVLWCFTDTPAQATWLSDEQRAWLLKRLQDDHIEVNRNHQLNLRQALTHPMVWILGLILFAHQSGSYGLTLWIPQIIKGLSGLSDTWVGLIAALPYIAATIGMIVIGRSSDRSGERFWHIAGPSLLGAVGFIASAYLLSPMLGMMALTVAAVGDLGSRGPFWTLPRRFLTGSASAAGIALINTLASLGGFVGPYAVGAIKQITDSYTGGLLFLAGMLIVSAIAVLRVRHAVVLQQVDAQ